MDQKISKHTLETSKRKVILLKQKLKKLSKELLLWLFFIFSYDLNYFMAK